MNDTRYDKGVSEYASGDVILVDQGLAVVRYQGDVRFSSGTWLGVELVEEKGNHDGFVNGTRYFKCKDDRGVFVKEGEVRQKIYPEELLDRLAIMNAECKTLRRENEHLGVRVKELENQLGDKAKESQVTDYLGVIEEGDRVRLSNRKSGCVKYIGRTHFAVDTMYGIELESWLSGGNDGSKGGRRYFKAKPGFGYFARKNMIVEVITRRDTSRRMSIKDNTPIGVNMGDMVEIDRNRRGTVKYIGPVQFDKGEFVGLELLKWSSFGHDGSVKGKRYFNCQSGKGYFARIDSVVRVISEDNDDGDQSDEADLPPSLEDLAPSLESKENMDRREPRKSISDLSLNDKVRLSRGKVGWVRYIGNVDFTEGEVVGMELTSWIEKGHNGTVRGREYFRCPPGRGYFTKRSNIAEINEAYEDKIQAPQISNRYKRSDSMMTDCLGVPHEDLEVGDRVQLNHGREGVVRYIGRVDGMKAREVVGVELDQWSVKGHDGSFRDKNYFECRPGRGYFTTRKAVKNVTLRRRDSIISDRSISKTIEEPKKQEALHVEVGDRVLISRGRTGVVRFIGSLSDNSDKTVVGLELDQWSDKGHDGSWKGRSYFRCADGRGYFTTREAIKEIVQPMSRRSSEDITPRRHRRSTGGSRSGSNSPRSTDGPLSPEDDDKATSVRHGRRGGIAERRSDRERSESRRRREREPVEFDIGDKVRLKRGKEGTVKYIGTVKGSDETLVGLELRQWYEKGNDGSFRGVHYFSVRGEGWGYFTMPSAIVENLSSRRD